MKWIPEGVFFGSFIAKLLNGAILSGNTTIFYCYYRTDMLDVIQKIRLIMTRKDKFALLGVTLLMTISALLEMAGIGVLVAVVSIFLAPDMAKSGSVMQSVAELINKWSDAYGIVTVLAATALLFVLKSLFSLGIIELTSKYIFGKQRDFAIRLYQSYLKSDYAKTSSRPIADLETNIHYCSMLAPYVLIPLTQLAGDVIVILLLGATLTAAMPLITVSGVLFMVFCGMTVQFSCSKLNRTTGERFMRAEADNARRRLAGLRNIAYIKSVSAEDFFADNYSVSEKISNRENRRLFFLGQIPRHVIETAAILLMLGIFSVLIIKGTPKAEILVIFTAIVAVMSRILPSLSRCHYNLMRIRQSKFMFDTLCTDLTAIGENENTPAGKSPTLEKELTIDQATYMYPGSDVCYPEPVKFSIPVRSSCGIAGKTGCGKTTLIEMLLALRHPSKGAITADGIDIFSNIKEWRSMTGYVPQTIHLIPGTLRENIAFGIAPEFIDDRKVRKATQMAQLSDFDPERIISADGNNLSGGQRQRIGIARALYRDVKLLILDEATSNLDTETEQAFVAALNNLKGKLTLIVIAHRENTLEQCDKIIRLSSNGD